MERYVERTYHNINLTKNKKPLKTSKFNRINENENSNHTLKSNQIREQMLHRFRWLRDTGNTKQKHGTADGFRLWQFFVLVLSKTDKRQSARRTKQK